MTKGGHILPSVLYPEDTKRIEDLKRIQAAVRELVAAVKPIRGKRAREIERTGKAALREFDRVFKAVAKYDARIAAQGGTDASADKT